MHIIFSILIVLAIVALVALFAWFLDWFFGDALPAGGADDTLDISDAVIDATFDGDNP